MVSSCDSQTGGEIVGNGEDEGLEGEWCPEGGDAAGEGNADDENDIEPVDVLIPVLAGEWRLGDVWLARVIRLCATLLDLACLGLGSSRDVRHEFWLDSCLAGSWLCGNHFCDVAASVAEADRCASGIDFEATTKQLLVGW